LRSIATAGIIFLCSFGAALAGLWLRRRLPAHHLSGESKEVVKLVVGLIATMSALVLGLLIASAKNFYDTQNTELQVLSANLVELDRVLTRYGPEAVDVRAELHRSIAAALAQIWSKDESLLFRPARTRLPEKVGRVSDMVDALQPPTDAQRALLARASQLTSSAAQTRLLMLEQAENPIAWPFLTTLVCWGTFLFFGFGLLTQRNWTVVTALGVGALSFASAAFLILELSGPLYGVMQISPHPLQAALGQMREAH
jgi:hypothetical protein